MGRRLSEAVAPQPEAGRAKSPLERKFADLVKRLMNEDGLDLAAAQALVREWIEDNVGRLGLEEKVKLYEFFCSHESRSATGACCRRSRCSRRPR